jgi:hypothetical protein
MNKGLKAHIYSTIIYIIPVIFILLNVTLNFEITITISVVYFILQLAIALISYLESWYDK